MSRSGSRRTSSRGGRSAARSSSRGAARRAPAPAANNNLGALLGTIAILVVVVGGIIYLNMEDSAKPRDSGGTGQTAADSGRSESNERPMERSSASSSKGKVQPTTPAPTVSDAQMAKSRALYKEAKELFNEALALQKAGKEKARFLELMRDSKRKIEAACENVSELMMWDEEAEMSDWIRPASVERHMREISQWIKLQARAHKVSYGQ
jgi:hypothetical protein